MAVFISYRRGGEGAYALHEALTARGIPSFFDKESIHPGSPFPDRLALAMLRSRVVVAFMDSEYLERPWCIYELRVATAPARADSNAPMDHLVVALPAEGYTAEITDRLPPVSASQSWPVATDTDTLVTLVEQRLAACPESMEERLDGLDDDAVRSLRSGALVPAPTKPPVGRTLLTGMPESLKERFVGRADLLWMVHDALDPGGTDLAPRSCAIEGGGGTGKSQLAAEYVSRYGRRHYPGGCLWVDATGGDENLARQLHAILRLFDPASPALDALGERASDRVDTLQRKLKECVAADERILWVVDNVPEPGIGGQTPQPLKRWCPVRDRVAFLCTSRRTGIKDVDHRVPVRELGVQAAVQLLTQEPVNTAWLETPSWERIARWLGCWPLGLRIAQASLADGYVTAGSLLQSALGTEPARALESEVDMLREEVVEDYVRGIAEVFHESYRALANKPQACRHAHLLARLSRAPLTESALQALVPAPSRGLLSKRSWIESTSTPGNGAERCWSMHRVIASYLRCLSDSEGDPDTELIELCGWLEGQLIPHPTLPAAILTRNLRVVMEGIRARLESNASPQLITSAGNLVLNAATWNLVDFELREARYYAASLAEDLGVDEELSERLSQGLAGPDTQVARSCVAVAGGMPHSEAAANFLIEAVRDARREVRFQVTPTASQMARADVLGVPLTREILARAEEWPAQVTYQLDSLLQVDTLPEIGALLFNALSDGNADQRRIACALFGRVLTLRRHDLSQEAAEEVCNSLLEVIFSDPEEDVARTASEALAAAGDSIYPALAEIIVQREKLGDQRWRRIVDGFVVYCTALERPPPSRFGWIVDDGESTFVMEGWPRAERKPDRFEPLAHIAVADPDPGVRSHASRALLGEVFGMRLPQAMISDTPISGGHDCWHARFVVDAKPADSGRVALANAVNDAIDQGKSEEVLPIAELAIAFDPTFSSAYWWRGGIMEAQGDFANARDDYTRVIELTPGFADAYLQRGLVQRRLARLEEALKDFEQALNIDPGIFCGRYYRAEILHLLHRQDEALGDVEAAIKENPDWDAPFELAAGIYGALGRWGDCVNTATRAIELGCPAMPARYYRAVAFTNLGQTASALEDLAQALAEAPGDERLTKLWSQISDTPPPIPTA